MLYPQMVWPLWPSWALLVSVLVLVPRRIWPLLILMSFAAVVLFDWQAGVSVRSIAWFIAADTIEVSTAALYLSYFFDIPLRLNSVDVMAKYLAFAVALPSSAAAFVAALGIHENYWYGWRVSFFSHVLALLILTPATLIWVADGHAWMKKSLAFRVEGTTLFAALVLSAYLTFSHSHVSDSPAVIYSLVPCLLWSALRFGSLGISTSMTIISLLSIWGTLHGHGPFSDPGPFDAVLSLQLFLLFTAIPFMFLAALVEERKVADRELRESEERLRLAAEAGKMYAFDWDTTTDEIVRSGQCADIFNWMEDPTRDTGRQFISRIHPEDRWVYARPDESLTPRNPAYQTDFRVLRPDGSVVWLESRGRALFDRQGRRLRIIGMATNVTARKDIEEALQRKDAQLAEAQRIAKLGSWRWELTSDAVTWSEELYRICGLDPNLPAPNFKEHPQLFTSESWQRLRCAVEQALHIGKPYELDIELVCPDGTTRWLHARGEAQRDSAGRIVQLYGTVQDIAERKGAEEMLQDMSGRLITAHEEERSRIARELHDDLSQRMALLQIGLEQFEQNPTGHPSEIRKNVHYLTEIAEEVSSNIHDLSHRLHPPKLDVLGLLPSLAGFCKEFSELHHIQVQFAHHDVPGNIPKDVTLCLFRIAQEALRNVVKHSGAVQAKVELLGLGHRMELCVSDTGVGFDPESVKGGEGIGLVSMRERLRLIEGDLTIESVSPHGTRIRARAPLLATGGTGKQAAYKAGA
jgi:PAS domain S-box-containing protein